MITATRHIGIVVRDLEKSLAFYRDLLGLTEFKRAVEEGDFIDNLVGIKGVRLEWVKLQGPDGSLLELLQYHSHPDGKSFSNAPSNQLGCSHPAFSVDDLTLTHKTLIDAGFHCVSPPQPSPDGNVLVLYCHDPDGVAVELVEELA